MIPVKLCGITSVDDAILAIRSGASAIGLIFYKNSPRAVDLERAKTIAKCVPESVAKVGVFVDETLETIHTIATAINLDFIQLHGNESPDYCAHIERPIIKAIRIRNEFTESDVDEYQVHALILDTYKPGIPGGTGTQFNWNQVQSLPISAPLILAGGLTPSNVLEGIRVVKPAAIDVNSGVEIYPGRKDADKVKALFDAVSSTGEYKNIFQTTKEK